MNQKHLISVQHFIIGFSALLALSGQAMATTTDFGALTPATSVNYGNTFSAPQNQFYDDYLFSIPTASVDSITSTIDLANYLGINNLQARLYSGTAADITTGKPANGVLEAWSTAITLPLPGGVTGTVAVISPITLNTGSYILEVRGDVTGSSGGSYSGVLNISPVPELETYSMMIGGIGLMGFMARRRKA